MPYEQYLASANTSPYNISTYTANSSTSGVTSTVIIDALVSITQTQYVSTGANSTAVAGIYGLTQGGISQQLNSYSYADPNTALFASNSGGQTSINEYRTIYGNESYSASGSELYAEAGDGRDVDGNSAGQYTVSSTSYSATGSWNSALSSFDGSGGRTTTSSFSFYLNTFISSGGTSGSSTWSPNLIGYYFGKITSITSLSVDLLKTTESTATFYGPLEGSETTYTYVYPTTIEHTFTNIKTLKDSKFFWDVEYQSKTFNIEWLGYAERGAQALGLVYSTTAESKVISEYATILMETDSFSSSNERESFLYGGAFSGDNDGASYTITYDIITTTAVESQTTLLAKELYSTINFFSYGFISTYTTGTTIYTAGTSSETVELISYEKQFVFTYDASANTLAGVSYSAVQTISTTSNFTQFVELSGLNKATSFIVRSFVTTTAPYTYRSNTYGVTIDGNGNPDGRSYSFAPVFPPSALVIRSPESSNPDTFYTEKASFASFAEPNYSTAFREYSPAKASLVLLALVPLNDTAEEGKYPSWISVYDGTFSGNDREQSTLESVTAYQSSSYVGSGATNVYQTITFFIDNNSDSQTTKTTSIAMSLSNSASSVSRLVRTTAENLDSAYEFSFLPSISLVGVDVVFTQGIHSNASYNIDKMLLNEYITAKSTFAGSVSSSFPISVSAMLNIYRNKFRIDKTYDEGGYNSFAVQLLQFGAVEEE